MNGTLPHDLSPWGMVANADLFVQAVMAGLALASVLTWTVALAKGLEGEAAVAYGRRLSGASMGLIGAVGALGGVAINLAFRQSFLSSGSGTGAFVAFLAFYAVCLAVTWAVYLRRPAVRTPEGTAGPDRARAGLSRAEV